MQSVTQSTKFGCKMSDQNGTQQLTLIESRCGKTGLRGFRPGPTKFGLYGHRRWLEA